MRRTTHTTTLIAAFGLLAAACGTDYALVPADQATLAPDEPATTAVARGGGVTLLADGARWRWTPTHLEDIVTPVFVRVDNGGDAPIRLTYERFEMTTPAGLTVHAIPPFEIERDARAPTATPPTGALALPPGPATRRVEPRYRHGPWRHAWPHRGFYIAPYHQRYYTGFNPYAGPWTPNYAYYDTYYRWEPSLPTDAMLQRALPEGVLEPGGSVSGFVYFEPTPRDGTPVQLTFTAVGADDGAQRATLGIPFIAE